MFTFTKKADYALLALSFLATEGVGRLVGPREIAAHHEIPGELLAKVMQTLAKKQLVTSVPGPTGGYRLGRDAVSISVAEVVEAVDGTLAIAQCWEPEHGVARCAQSGSCTIRGPLERIQIEMIRLLRGTSLADVCEPVEASDGFKPRLFTGRAHLTVLPDTTLH